MTRRRWNRTVAATLLCGLLAQLAAGQVITSPPAAALISELSGGASIATAGRARVAARRFDTLTPGQTLEMSSSGRGVLILADGRRFELGPRARATVGERLTDTSGPISELPDLPTLPRLAPLGESRPKGPPGAVRLRGARITGMRPYHAVVATETVTLRFDAVAGASRFAIEIDDRAGQRILRVETTSTELAVPAGTLEPGRNYFWSVETLDKVGATARGRSRFSTIAPEDVRRRDALRRALALDDGAAAVALLAEVDRRLALYPDALEGFRAAQAVSPDPAVERAIRWLEDVDRAAVR